MRCMLGAVMRAAKRIRGTRLRSVLMARRRRSRAALESLATKTCAGVTATRLSSFGVVLSWLAAVIALPSSSALAAGLPLQPVADIPLGGNTTRLDYT